MRTRTIICTSTLVSSAWVCVLIRVYIHVHTPVVILVMYDGTALNPLAYGLFLDAEPLCRFRHRESGHLLVCVHVYPRTSTLILCGHCATTSTCIRPGWRSATSWGPDGLVADDL